MHVLLAVLGHTKHSPTFPGVNGICSNVVVEALCYKLDGSGIRIFFKYLIVPVALVPGVYSAFNRNNYQKKKNKVSGE
jgi:hypothetical protein